MMKGFVRCQSLRQKTPNSFDCLFLSSEEVWTAGAEHPIGYQSLLDQMYPEHSGDQRSGREKEMHGSEIR